MAINFPYEIDKLNTIYKDVDEESAHLVKQYNTLVSEAINTYDFSKVNLFAEQNAEQLKPLLITASTINDIQNAILSLEKYTISKHNQICVSSIIPENQVVNDIWIKVNTDNLIDDVLQKDENGEYISIYTKDVYATNVKVQNESFVQLKTTDLQSNLKEIDTFINKQTSINTNNTKSINDINENVTTLDTYLNNAKFKKVQLTDDGNGIWSCDIPDGWGNAVCIACRFKYSYTNGSTGYAYTNYINRPDMVERSTVKLPNGSTSQKFFVNEFTVKVMTGNSQSSDVTCKPVDHYIILMGTTNMSE